MLQDTLKSLLADTYIVYFKAHSYHWNVEGPNFAQYHAFLGDYYNDVYGSIDTIAELIRTLDVYAPVSFASLLSQSTIDESSSIPEAKAMLTQLLRDNDVLLARLVKAYNEAEQASEFSISNFLQDRIQAHEKHAWMFRAITK
jgi:starvation-inducible DNA-binding protein